MPIVTFTAGTTIVSDDVDANFALCVLTDTARTITVTHTWTASQTFTGGWTAAAACTISSGGIAVTGNSTITGTLTALTGITSSGTAALATVTFSVSVASTTALATPSALSATQWTGFASTVSGAAIMGYGTTNDVSLMNRAGTVCLGVGPNTTTVNVPGKFTIGGFSLAGSEVFGVTGISRFTAQTAVGDEAHGSIAFGVRMTGSSSFLTGTGQRGIGVDVVFSSASTTYASGLKVAGMNFVDATYTVTDAHALHAGTWTKPAAVTITTAYGLKVDDVNVGGTNYAIYTGDGALSFGAGVTIRSGNLTLSSGTITASGTVNGQTLSATASFTGSIAATTTVSGTNFIATGGLAANAASRAVLSHSGNASTLTAFGSNASTAGNLNLSARSSDGSETVTMLTLDGDASTGVFGSIALSGITTLAGSGAISGFTTVSFSGNLAINTNKFTVTAASGNTLVAGTLSVTGDFAINTNKFTVTASSGNTLVAGTLTATGAFGCNGATAQTAVTIGAALAAYATGAFGLDSDANMSALHADVVAMRAALVANGILTP